MQHEQPAVSESSEILDMWVLRGREMRKILRASGTTVKSFGARFGRSQSTIFLYFEQNFVKSVWRDRLMLVVGDEFYFRELLAIREREGNANDLLRQHVCALNKRRQRKPVDVRNAHRV